MFMSTAHTTDELSDKTKEDITVMNYCASCSKSIMPNTALCPHCEAPVAGSPITPAMADLQGKGILTEEEFQLEKQDCFPVRWLNPLKALQ
jgi:uncharacterized OB-fold protein